MNSKQESKLNMYHSVQKFATDNVSIVATVPAFQNAFDDFKDKVLEIGNTQQRMLHSSKGYTDGKMQARNAMENLTDQAAAALFSFASEQGDLELKGEVKFTPTELTRKRDEEIGAVATKVYDLANANLAALADYGIDANFLSIFLAAINLYASKVNAPRTVITQKSAAAATLISLFDECDQILKDRMDTAAKKFRETEPEFYQTYRNNRKILDAKTYSTGLRFEVKNKSGKQVGSASISFPSLQMVIITSTDGIAELKPVPLGTYEISVSATGYQTALRDDIKTHLGKTQTFIIIIEDEV